MVQSDNSLARLLLDSIVKDYIHRVESLLSTNPDLLDAVERISGENPLFIACNHGSIRVAEEIARRKPQLISGKHKHGPGCTAMHAACCQGDVSLIRLLAELDPQVCLVEDSQSKIPLHISAIQGYEEAIRVLVNACPESLHRLTSQQETALHLAVKNYHCGAFEVLIEEIEKLHLEYLLNRKDHEGNTVLHIATSNKLTRIVQLLLPDSSASTRRVAINSTNNNDHTALDFYYRISGDRAARQIGHILLEAGAVEGRSLSPQILPSMKSSERKIPCPLRKRLFSLSTFETRNVLLVVLVMVVGTAFTIICNLPGGLSKEKTEKATFYLMGVISGQLPTIFYLMLCNTMGVLPSMCVIMVLIWSLPFGTVLLFVLATAFTAYVLILSKILPRFSVRIGPCNLSSSRFLWLSAITFILSGAAVTTLAKCLFSRLRPKRGITTNQMEQV